MKHFYEKVRAKFQFFLIGLLVAVLSFACQSTSGDMSPNVQSTKGCRVVEHALGQVCAPEEPQRLVSLDNPTFANILALGVQPIGTSSFDNLIPNYLIEYANQVELLGSSGQPSLEKIVQLTPDLIVGIEPVGKTIFQQLSQIAPTALGNWRGFPFWREHFDFVASVLGEEDEAAKVWENYFQKVANIQATLGNKLQDTEISVIYAYGVNITIDAENSFAGSILADIGLRRPDGHAAVDRGIIGLSEERITQIDADILFVSVYDEDSEKLLAEWQQKPLWKQLKAVQNNQVYVVDADIWRGGNPIAADLMLDELLQILSSALPA